MTAGLVRGCLPRPGRDLDGDGYDDLLIGASGDDTGGEDAGCVYVQYGPLSLSLYLSDADVKLIGSPGSWTGLNVRWLGDVGGFGAETLGIGIHREDLAGESLPPAALRPRCEA